MHAQTKLQLPKNSSILIDTNVLIDSAESVKFISLYEQMREASIGLVLSEVVKLEFVRGTNNHQKALDFLESIFKTSDGGMTLPLDSEVYKRAYEIEKIYRYQGGNKKSGFADLLFAAQVARYSIPKRLTNQSVLATENHKDFLPTLFDLLQIINIRVESGSIKTVGFYIFNTDRFGELL
ncbi:PIN domain-containing protein [bacterium]|nr:PIN domain-containing protein [bacterium]